MLRNNVNMGSFMQHLNLDADSRVEQKKCRHVDSEKVSIHVSSRKNTDTWMARKC